jgi:hypothetical protein
LQKKEEKLGIRPTILLPKQKVSLDLQSANSPLQISRIKSSAFSETIPLKIVQKPVSHHVARVCGET